ncbi:MAG TPA: hypothetical protein VFY29_17505 [Terriglobia bacterium]|nr:hypothetical protein [Terriglobia bacterium]
MKTVRLFAILLAAFVCLSACDEKTDTPAPPVENGAASGAPAQPPASRGTFAVAVDRIGDIPNPAEKQPIQIKIDQNLDMSGWAVDEGAQSLAGTVDVVIDGKPFPAVYGSDRPDVAAHFKNPELGKSGYTFSVAARGLGPGKHVLTVRPMTADKTKYSESNPITIEIR